MVFLYSKIANKGDENVSASYENEKKMWMMKFHVNMHGHHCETPPMTCGKLNIIFIYKMCINQQTQRDWLFSTQDRKGYLKLLSLFQK